MSDAEETAVAVLGWLAGQPDLMSRFLALSGLSADGLRQAASEPGFFGGLLAFLMNHEPTMMAFCDETDIGPERVAAAYHALAGDPHDTGMW